MEIGVKKMKSKDGAIAEFLIDCKIRKTKKDDKRGWYICNHYGHLYLHKDGIIYDGVQGEVAFWETKEAATEFYYKWGLELRK